MGKIEQFNYDNGIVRNFAVATAIWGLVGMLVGVLIAFQIFTPGLNMGPELTFGRLRPLHTNAAIFAFVGNGIFMGVYYSLQRLLKTRMFSDMLSKIHFWGWQLIIVSAALTLPFGITSAKEYAELEWPIDIAIALVWIVFGLNMFGTILKRRENHLYVAIWFYIATWITVTVLHVVNNLEYPWSWIKSYPVFAGVQDALVQWWYGHNALDKLAGAIARDGGTAEKGVIVLTSRVSIEMVQKSAMIGAPTIVAVSAPTALAVRMAEACGMTLAAIARKDGFEIFTHPRRIEGTTKSDVA